MAAEGGGQTNWSQLLSLHESDGEKRITVIAVQRQTRGQKRLQNVFWECIGQYQRVAEEGLDRNWVATQSGKHHVIDCVGGTFSAQYQTTIRKIVFAHTMRMGASKRSRARLSSRAFIVAIAIVCRAAQTRGLIPLSIHRAIKVSPAPISIVSGPAAASPVTAATINLCRGLIPNSLNHIPKRSHTAAVTNVSVMIPG